MLQKNTNFFYLINFFISLFFYKLLGLLGLNISIEIYEICIPLRLFFCIGLFIVLVNYSKVLVPILLNNFVFQLLFFIILGCENLLLGLIFLFWLDLSYYSYSYSPLISGGCLDVKP